MESGWLTIVFLTEINFSIYPHRQYDDSANFLDLSHVSKTKKSIVWKEDIFLRYPADWLERNKHQNCRRNCKHAKFVSIVMGRVQPTWTKFWAILSPSPYVHALTKYLAVLKYFVVIWATPSLFVHVVCTWPLTDLH